MTHNHIDESISNQEISKGQDFVKHANDLILEPEGIFHKI